MRDVFLKQSLSLVLKKLNLTAKWEMTKETCTSKLNGTTAQN